MVAPDLGAFPERLHGRAWSWVRPWDGAPADWFAFFTRVREQNFLTGISPTPPEFVAAEADDLVKPWSYDLDYLKGLDPPDPAMIQPPKHCAGKTQ